MSTTNDFTGQTCGIYPRVSTRKQAKSDRRSLDDQIDACRAYAEEAGMVVDEECVRKEAYTSTQMQRPELNQLLDRMKKRGVRHLVIDRVDRLTRAGMAAAFAFLQQFTRAGVTLHIVLSELVIRSTRDDDALSKLLEGARAARKDNENRARIVDRAKQSYARKGRFNRGNHPPYGYRYEACAWDTDGKVIDKRHVPDERSFASLGYPTTFAPTPYAARKEMLRLYAVEGLPLQPIANLLNASGVPTASVLLRREGTCGKWWAKTVRDIIEDRVNEGVLVNFRTTSKLADPDDTHDDEWHFVRKTKADKQIIVVPPHGGPTPLIDERTAAIIAYRREKNSASFRSRRTTYAGRALLAGGLSKCGICGTGTLAVRAIPSRDNDMPYLYYRCHRHELQPLECPGLSFPVRLVDPGAWFAVETALLSMDQSAGSDNYLDLLAREDADHALHDTGDGPAMTLRDLQAVRDALQQQVANLAADVGRTATSTSRLALIAQMDALEPEIAEAKQRIAAYERQAERQAERRAVLADSLEQYRRHLDLISALSPYEPEDIPILAMILRAVGARLTIKRDERGDPDIAVELTLTPATALPWFTSDRAAEIIDTRKSRVRDFGHPNPSASDGERSSFSTPERSRAPMSPPVPPSPPARSRPMAAR